jgi:hypothetical protein
MSRIFQIIGDTTVDLLSPTGIIPQRQVEGIKLNAAQVFDDMREVPETLRLNLQGSSVDNVGTQIQALWKLLCQVKEYRESERPTAPVYLKQQLTGETKERYATVKDVPMFDWPAMLRTPLELDHTIENFGLTVIREHPWRDTAPATYPAAALTLTATDGPAGETLGFLSNFQDSIAITHIYNYDDSAGTYSGDLVATDAATLFPASPAVNDAIHFVSVAPLSQIIINLNLAAVYACTMTVKYSKGGAVWGSFTLGTNLLIYPESALTTLFQTNGRHSISMVPPSDSASDTFNGQAGYHYRIQITAFTSWTTSPTTDKKCYAQTKPYIEIPSTAILGDGSPLLCMQMFPLQGGGAAVGVGNISRILIGARSETDPARLAGFFSHLLLGDHNPPASWGFTTAYGTDTSAVAEPLAPGGYKARCTFATDATLKARVTLTGSLKLKYYTGRFKVLLECAQVNGAAGDCKVRASIMIGGSTAGYPVAYLPAATSAALQTFNAGCEVIDLTGDGYINIPFVPTAKGDSLEADFIVSIWASRSSGASQLDLYQVIFLPCDEYGQDLQDPKSDVVSGGSALRGGSMLENDAGVIMNRCAKKLIIGANNVLSEEWRRGGDIYHPKPARQYRFYFVILRWPATWYTARLTSARTR